MKDELPTSVLLVDDEPKVIDFMKPFLVGEGFTVLHAASGPEALKMAAVHQPDIVVLDWMLPGLSGLDVCKALREASKVGILMVTARSDEADKVAGLLVGADDYLVKPVGLRELVARIRAVLRRMSDASDLDANVLVRGDVVIDEARFRVCRGDKDIVLTPTEFKILLTLAERPGVVYTRLQLLKAAMGDAYLNYERTVDTHVSHLRQKIEEDVAQPKYIQTVYGVGYRFGDGT